jgi:hypothetical protein
MMREAVKAIEKLSGKDVLVLAPSSSAVEILKKVESWSTGTFSLSSVYRLLVREGLDRPRFAEGSGPTMAFETELANALWMPSRR